MIAASTRHALWASSASIKDKLVVVKQWYEHCTLTHGNRCMPKVERAPSRLIEVGTVDVAPRIVLSKDQRNSDQRYTTLSHCWGANLPIRTLMSNVYAYGEGIRPQTIPRTFEDAILITRALGISFIWIDALCIIQDSADDWAQEAGKMRDIYGGSSLNIAASDSPNSGGGCFATKDSSAEMFVLAQEIDEHEILLRLQLGDTRQHTKQTILSSRGWVLQEQLLSHRIVSCLSDEMHWECGQAHETEAGIRYDIHGSATRENLQMYQNPGSLQRCDMWRSWMSNYSERNFSFWHDRLPALAGIAENYQNITGDIPIVGLWKNSICGDLLWVRHGLISNSSDLKVSSAHLPSWSWLSCPSSIRFDIWKLTRRVNGIDRNVIDRDHCKLVDFLVEWTSLPFVSAVKSAYITLCGPIIEATIRVREPPDGSDPTNFTITHSGNHVPGTGQFDRGMAASGRYYCLLLRSRTHSQTGAMRQIFMILQNRCGSIYERVGIACVHQTVLFTTATWKELLIH